MPRSRIYYGYWLVAVAFVAQFVAFGVFSYVLGAFLVPMTQDLGWSRAEFTLSRSVSQFMMGLTGFFIGTYVDRYGGRPLMLIGTVILSTALYAHSFVEGLWVWIALNGVLVTIGGAMAGNLVVNVTLAKWFVERRGEAIAWAAMGLSFAGIALTPLITWLVDSVGWRESWRWLALGTVVLMLPASLLMRRAPEDYGLHPDGHSAATVAAGGGAKAAADFRSSMTRREALRTRSFYLLVTAFSLFSINIVVMLLHTIPYLTDEGFSRTQAAFAIVLTSIPAMLTKPIWGRLADRMNPKPLAALGALVTGGSVLVIVYGSNSTILWVVYGGYFMLGMGWGGMIPLQEVIWASFFGRRYLGAVRSAALPATLLISAIAPWAVSYYHDHSGSYHEALLVIAVLNLTSAVLMYFLPSPRREAVMAPV